MVRILGGEASCDPGCPAPLPRGQGGAFLFRQYPLEEAFPPPFKDAGDARQRGDVQTYPDYHDAAFTVFHSISHAVT